MSKFRRRTLPPTFPTVRDRLYPLIRRTDRFATGGAPVLGTPWIQHSFQRYTRACTFNLIP